MVRPTLTRCQIVNMGIRGLTTYIDQRVDSLLTQIDLKNTKVIIDGNGLYYRLYFSSQLDCRSGGQYNRFHDIITSFFKSLEARKVQPYVVLDGSSDPSDNKLGTDIARTEGAISDAHGLATSSFNPSKVRPTLLRRTFLQTLSELEVPFAVCDCEADGEIASLATKWECPVISSDSDFFIFDLKGGYIPLKYLEWSSRQVKAKLFRAEKLAAHLGIQKDLLPLLASIVGNDLISDDVRTSLYTALKIYKPIYIDKIMKETATFLRSKSKSLQEGLESVLTLWPRRNREELRQVLEASVHSYKVCDSELAAYFENDQVYSTRESRSKVPIETWVSRNIRQGLFPVISMEALIVGRVFFKPQVENFSSASADECSLELRKFIYGVLREGEVVEWRRRGINLHQYTVQPTLHLQEIGKLPHLRTIPDLETPERRKVCLSLLESNTDHILSLPAESQLFAASLRYWMKHFRPAIKPSPLPSFLVCSLMLAEGEQLQDAKSPRSPYASRRFDLEAQHSFAQWQCVMRDAVNLNLILQEPLTTPRIRLLYDGPLVQTLVSDLKNDPNAHMSWQSREDYKKLYDAVTQGISTPSTPGRY